MAGPDGVFEPGDEVDLPAEKADKLIAGGAAVAVEEPAPNEAVANRKATSTTEPFSDDEWRRGIPYDEWVNWRARDVYQELRDNWVPVTTIPEDPADSRKNRISEQACHRLRDVLRRGVAEGEIELGTPADSAIGAAQPISRDALDEVIEVAPFSFIRPSEICFRRQWIEVRVYRPGHFSGTRSDGTERPTEADAVAPESNRAPKGKPGRQPDYDWDAFIREMMRLANSINGLPEPRARIADHMAEWCQQKWGDKTPVDSTIREHIAKWLPPDYKG